MIKCEKQYLKSTQNDYNSNAGDKHIIIILKVVITSLYISHYIRYNHPSYIK